jgi:hypothetical protein
MYIDLVVVIYSRVILFRTLYLPSGRLVRQCLLDRKPDAAVSNRLCLA